VGGAWCRVAVKESSLLYLLGDSTAQSIGITEALLAEQEQVLGSDHPDALTTRNNLANAYQDAGWLRRARRRACVCDY
jgi:hypothetical protein